MVRSHNQRTAANNERDLQQSSLAWRGRAHYNLLVSPPLPILVVKKKFDLALDVVFELAGAKL